MSRAEIAVKVVGGTLVAMFWVPFLALAIATSGIVIDLGNGISAAAGVGQEGVYTVTKRIDSGRSITTRGTFCSPTITPCWDDVALWGDNSPVGTQVPAWYSPNAVNQLFNSKPLVYSGSLANNLAASLFLTILFTSISALAFIPAWKVTLFSLQEDSASDS